MANQHTSIQDRLWSKVVKDTESGCWLWTGRKQREGYGRMVVRGVTTGVHRVSFEIANGPIPKGMTLDHLCRNKACVNPAHLEPVTGGENSRRYMLSRPTCKRGHEWTDENTRIDRAGKRVCRACARLHWHIKQTKQEAA